MRFSFLKNCTVAVTLVFFSLNYTPLYATDCSAWPEFQSSEFELSPRSLELSNLQNELNASPSAEGMIFEFRRIGTDVWMDVGYVPGNASTLSGLRSAFMAFRLLSDDFDSFVFSDGNIGLFKISEPMAREIGCQFIWGREDGQNPIYLLRVFYKNLTNFADGQPAVTGFNGSLLGDTSLAMGFNNDVFVRKWLLSALQE